MQKKAFLAVVNMDYPGLFTLIDLSSKDYSNLGCTLLQRLA